MYSALKNNMKRNRAGEAELSILETSWNVILKKTSDKPKIAKKSYIGFARK